MEVIIKKDGKIFTKERFKKDAKEKEIKKLYKHLSYELILEEGVTLELLINIILKEKTFFNNLFKPDLNKFKLESIKDIMDAKDNSDEGIVNSYSETLRYLEVSKMFELLSYKDNTNSIDLFPLLVGIGQPDPSDEGGDEGDDMEDDDVFMPIGLFPLSKLKKFEVSLQKNVELFRSDENGDLTLLLTAVAPLTVYEVFTAILYEITYFGTDEDKKEQLKEQTNQRSTSDKIEDLELYLQELVDSEQYEKASKIKKDLDKLKVVKK